MAPVHPNLQSQPTGSHRVVEVVDCLAETIVGVTHLEEPSRRSYKRAYLAGLVVFLCIAGASFVSALSTTSANKEAFRQHVAAGKVSHEFRPVRVSPALEWAGATSLAMGVFLSFAFFLSGRKKRSTFVSDSAGEESTLPFEMVDLSEGLAKLRIHPSMTGSAVDDSGVHSIEELCAVGRASRDSQGWYELNLVEGTKVSVVSGNRSTHMSWINRGSPKAVVASWKLDSRFAAYLAGSAALAMLLAVVLNSIVPDTHTLNSDAFASSQRLLNMKVKPQEEAIVEPESDGDIGQDSDEMSEEASTAGAQGTTGIESATLAKASMAVKRRADAPSMSKEQVRGIASHSGILGVAGSSQLFANMNSNVDFASGDAFDDLYGGMDGGPAGHQIGTLSGSWGTDVHSISDTWGTVKSGNYKPSFSRDPNGKCTNPAGCKGGPGTVKLRKHNTDGPHVTPGPIKHSGTTDGAIIRRLIRRKLARIRFCYEQRLVSSPSLRGTLVTSFTINANGAVIGAKSKGMGDSGMQSCVSQAISSIQFPKVPGGGLVNVKYPFTFQPAGS